MKRFSQIFDSNVSNFIIDFNDNFSLKIAILMMEKKVMRANFTVLTCIEATDSVCSNLSKPKLSNMNYLF